jgi:hypothetical protein
MDAAAVDADENTESSRRPFRRLLFAVSTQRVRLQRKQLGDRRRAPRHRVDLAGLKLKEFNVSTTFSSERFAISEPADCGALKLQRYRMK